jgi:hypothetical protein
VSLEEDFSLVVSCSPLLLFRALIYLSFYLEDGGSKLLRIFDINAQEYTVQRRRPHYKFICLLWEPWYRRPWVSILFCGKGSHPLLWACSRAARGKITSGISKLLYGMPKLLYGMPKLFCNFYSIYIICKCGRGTRVWDPWRRRYKLPYGLDDPGFESRQGQETFLSCKTYGPVFGTHPVSYSMATGTCSPPELSRVQWSPRESNRLLVLFFYSKNFICLFLYIL